MGERRPHTALFEGVDYYIENGRWVFTATYLLKRGYCCTSGCRHCPYRVGRSRQDETARPGSTDDSEK